MSYATSQAVAVANRDAHGEVHTCPAILVVDVFASQVAAPMGSE